MTLHLHDTATRTTRPFVPLEPGKASIYLCGLTVQGPPHIGHVRNWINMDILRRWLTFVGYEVTFVRNVTDIDDKIIVKSAAEDEPWWSLAFRNEREVAYAEQVLGCLPPSYEPRATQHMTEMIQLIDRLIERGHAYESDGDVYFDILSWPAYGELSGQKVADMLPAGDSVGDDRKRDARDFALWKAAKPGEPSWPTPWGPGRPGWHLECSAMATKYLGPAFDIHGGGLDLEFPHHENELAQSRAAGDAFAQYWLHNGLVSLGGQKMSKSLGNTLQVREVVQRWRPVEIRYYLGAAHYRSVIEYSPEALDEAAIAYRRIERFFLDAAEMLRQKGIDEIPLGDPPTAFVEAMNDDLGVPAAIGVIHERLRPANTELSLVSEVNFATGLGSVETFLRIVGEMRAMTEILGLYPGTWGSAPPSSSANDFIAYLLSFLNSNRASARRAKDFAKSDEIRDALAELGVEVKDTRLGTTYETPDGQYLIREEP